MHLLPCHACWLCWLRLPHRPPPNRNRWISYRWLHPGDHQLSVHIGHQDLGDLRPRTRDTEIVGLDKLHGESTWVGRPALYLPLDLAQVGNDDDIEISLNGLLTDCDQEDRDGKLSSLWRTGLDPWDWTQDTVGPFRFLLPRLCVHSIWIGSLAVDSMAIAWSGKGFPQWSGIALSIACYGTDSIIFSQKYA